MKTLVSIIALSLVAAPAHAGPLDFIKSAVKAEAKKRLNSELEHRGISTAHAQDSTPAPTEARLVQNGTTVATADEVLAPETGEGAANRKGFRQEGGTTVPTADDVQAPQGEERIGLLLPAIQKAQASSQAQGKPFRQEGGTTVPTADDVQAPQGEERKGLLLPAVQKAQAEPKKRRKMSQNGTTVATASEVQAPQRD